MRILRKVFAHVRFDVAVGSVRCNHDELISSKLHDSEVCLQLSALIEPLRIHDLTLCTVDVGRG